MKFNLFKKKQEEVVEKIEPPKLKDYQLEIPPTLYDKLFVFKKYLLHTGDARVRLCDTADHRNWAATRINISGYTFIFSAMNTVEVVVEDTYVGYLCSGKSTLDLLPGLSEKYPEIKEHIKQIVDFVVNNYPHWQDYLSKKEQAAALEKDNDLKKVLSKFKPPQKEKDAFIS